MNIHEQTIQKINELPESLIQEVNDFIDFIMIKNKTENKQLQISLNESLEIAESDCSDYLINLENYEEKLAKGEIKW